MLLLELEGKNNYIRLMFFPLILNKGYSLKKCGKYRELETNHIVQVHFGVMFVYQGFMGRGGGAAGCCRVMVGRRGGVGRVSSPFHIWVAGPAILGDRWSENGGAGVGKQDRVFLL